MTAPTRVVDATSDALKLRDEQLRARVRYYRAELPTNAELDAITERVVAELQSLAAASQTVRPSREIEQGLVQALGQHLARLLSPQRARFVERKLEDVQRRLTQSFFQSELYERIQAGTAELPSATWPEQALYFALKRHESLIAGDVDAITSDEAVRARAREALEQFTRSLCSTFLARTTPELERLLAIYRSALRRFLAEDLARSVGAFAHEVIHESGVAAGHTLDYKLTEDRFDAFRTTFERRFLERLLTSIQPRIAAEAATVTFFREATVRFVSDPRVHAELCAVLCEGVYDHLHGDGFLDLSGDWRRLIAE